jgi:hypothetical protein
MSLSQPPLSSGIRLPLSGLLRSYVADVGLWASGIATGYSIAAGLLVGGALCLVAALTVAVAALFHWIETTYGVNSAYGAIGGALFVVGIAGLAIGARLVKRPAPPLPRGGRQIQALNLAVKQVVAATTLQRLLQSTQSSSSRLHNRPLYEADPRTQALAGAAAILLAAWIIASRIRTSRSRVYDG